MTLTLTRPQEAHTLTSAPLPALRVVVPTEQAAQRQFWRHVANRLCLAILADAREPLLTAHPIQQVRLRRADRYPRCPDEAALLRAVGEDARELLAALQRRREQTHAQLAHVIQETR